MTLSWNPHLAHDVLCFLARLQGREENPYTDEQPGKILHELHTGELARVKEVPFGLFYGSVDATPLFLLLAAEYLTWTGDLALYRQITPNLDAAWRWITEYMDGRTALTRLATVMGCCA
jgi:glycogen debranching enzyme